MPKLCMRDGCPYPKLSGRHKCQYHWLKDQPIEVQIEAAQAREASAAEPRRGRVSEKDWPAGERWCSGCQSFVPLWYCSKSSARCKACSSLAAHSARVEAVYGISSAEYNALLELQGGVCYICQRKPRKRRLAVDHDHKTEAVRGLLCADSERGCNAAILGNIRDLDMARRIVEYLEHPPYDRLKEDHHAAPGDLPAAKVPDWTQDPAWSF